MRSTYDERPKSKFPVVVVAAGIVFIAAYWFLGYQKEEIPERQIAKENVVSAENIEPELVIDTFIQIEHDTIVVHETSKHVSINLDKTEYFYIGIDNPLHVETPSEIAKEVSVKASEGSLRKSYDGYFVRVKFPGDCKITVTHKGKQLASKTFRAKQVPDPVPMIGGKWTGKVHKPWLVAQTGVSAISKGFDYDVRFMVVSFTVSAIIKGYQQKAKSNSARFTQEQKRLLKQTKAGSIVSIYDITARGPDGTTRELTSLVFTIR